MTKTPTGVVLIVACLVTGIVMLAHAQQQGRLQTPSEEQVPAFEEQTRRPSTTDSSGEEAAAARLAVID
ncbi:MAG: hypothetical protein JXQ73_15660, partial [Phycisphaerae bacterium]|nr:hypothetical protein [Phycisphaerae bacterium]